MRKDVTPRDTLLDRRVVERNIRKGIVTREEYDGFLQGLPDVSAQAELIRARLGENEEPEGADVGDDDEDDEDEG